MGSARVDHGHDHTVANEAGPVQGVGADQTIVEQVVGGFVTADDGVEFSANHRACTGGGFDVYLANNLVLNAEATVLLTTGDFNTPAADDLDDLYYLSVGVGLRYQF